MASPPPTRSLRRAEGLTFNPSRRHNSQINTYKKQHNQANTGRRKRTRDSFDSKDDDLKSKKPRIAIELDPRLNKTPPRRRTGLFVHPPSSAPTGLLSPHDHAAPQVDPAAQPPPKKHADKVGAGIRHELDRLQPSGAGQKLEGRKLRSQEGTRFKSDLALYFPDYDVVIGNEPEETHFLNVDTCLIITDSHPPAAKVPKLPTSKLRLPKVPPKDRLRSFPSELFEKLHEAQRVDFTFLNKTFKGTPQTDPLSDSYYEDSGHRRQERLERSIRNTEKGRAQHERDQVIRLLEALQGHDWLKVMGVSGITESKKKDYEPAREYFIRGCQGIVEKFRIWKEEEKRRKHEKERAIVQAEAGEDEAGDLSDGDPPDYSDVDHAAARQLHEEAIARSAPLAPRPAKTRRTRGRGDASDHVAVAPVEKDFVSFFAKRHLRDAALGKHRRSGRSISAWGHPIPDVAPCDFDLPAEFRTKDTLEANARRRRMHRRVNSRE